ncbi:MAG: SurA N-terminal domain-containing protein [Candidatus Neomarinimicrobiota bacterium]
MAVMTSMRTKMHIVLWAVLILFLLSMTVGGLVGGADILDQLLGKTNPAEAVGVINGEKIPPNFFNQLVNQQLEQYRAGGQTVSDQTLESVRNQVWENIIRDNLVSEVIEEMGITATDEEVLFHLQNNPPQFLRTMPAFQTDGQFDLQKYLEAINNPEGNEWAPVEQIMKNNIIPNYKLQKILYSSISVADYEVRQEFIRRNIDFTINAIHVVEDNVAETDIEVTENEIKRAYNNRKDEFDQPESRNMRFIYWKKEASKTDTVSVYDDALYIIEQINSGEDFADLANLHSEDPGNNSETGFPKGGDLGWFERGQMVKSFSDAAFNAKKGAVIGPVLSQFGYHIIKIIDKRTTEGKDQVHGAHILLQINFGAESRDALRRDATLFSYDAQDYGFDAAIDTHSVVASEVSVTEDGIIVPQVGQLRNAARFAFNSAIGTVSSPMENDDYYAVFVYESMTPAGPTPLEAVEDRIEQDIKKDKIATATKTIATELRDQINNGLTFDDIDAQEKGYEIVTAETKKLNRGFTSIGLSNFVAGALLSAESGAVLGPLKTGRGYAIIFVQDIAELDAEQYEIRKDILKSNLLINKQNQVYENWLIQLKDDADIEDFRKYHF